MSEEICALRGAHNLTLTEYWGGAEKGKCVQITGENCDKKTGYVGLTVAEAEDLISALNSWLEPRP